MNLELEQAIKKHNIQGLKKEIEAKTQIIKEEEERLNYLKELYIKKQQSELPILLFQIADQIPDVEYTNFYQNIYYFVDNDEIKCVNEYRPDKMLPNAVDLRADFEYIKVPKKVCNINSYDFSDEIQFAVEVLKDKIGNLLKMFDIDSWQELGTLLSKKSSEKSPVKVLKKDE